MNELRGNPLAGQWFTIASERVARPSDVASGFLPAQPSARRGRSRA